MYLIWFVIAALFAVLTLVFAVMALNAMVNYKWNATAATLFFLCLLGALFCFACGITGSHKAERAEPFDQFWQERNKARAAEFSCQNWDKACAVQWATARKAEWDADRQAERDAKDANPSGVIRQHLKWAAETQSEFVLGYLFQLQDRRVNEVLVTNPHLTPALIRAWWNDPEVPPEILSHPGLSGQDLTEIRAIVLAGSDTARKVAIQSNPSYGDGFKAEDRVAGIAGMTDSELANDAPFVLSENPSDAVVLRLVSIAASDADDGDWKLWDRLGQAASERKLACAGVREMDRMVDQYGPALGDGTCPESAEKPEACAKEHQRFLGPALRRCPAPKTP